MTVDNISVWSLASFKSNLEHNQPECFVVMGQFTWPKTQQTTVGDSSRTQNMNLWRRRQNMNL